MRQEMLNILYTAQTREPITDPLVFTTKLGEEFGELCEAVLQKVGYLRHKKTQENPMEEAADVLQLLLIILSKTYSEMSAEEILGELTIATKLKFEKYLTILEPEYNSPQEREIAEGTVRVDPKDPRFDLGEM